MLGGNKNRHRRLATVGETLKPVIDAMWTWGEGYQESVRSGKVPGSFT